MPAARRPSASLFSAVSRATSATRSSPAGALPGASTLITQHSSRSGASSGRHVNDDLLQGLVQPIGVLGAPLGEVRAAAAGATGRLGDLLHQLAGVNAGSQVLGDAGYEGHLAIDDAAVDHDTPSETLSHAVNHSPEAVRVQAVQARLHHRDPVDLRGAGHQLVGP